MALVQLKDLLGHTRIETTMQYLKVVPMNLKAAIKNIEFD
jgi:site-specific recombinase XerD